jgi:hypothetical protein
MRHARIKACLATIGAAGAALVAAPAALAAPDVHCGDTLTASTVLTQNLTCTTPVGLTLAPDVTLDLGGHTLAGPGSGTGVLVASTGHEVVKNGRITHWGTGIVRAPRDLNEPPPTVESRVDVTFITVDHSSVGVDTTASEVEGPAETAFYIRSSRFFANATGVAGVTADAHISYSSFVGNTRGLDFSDFSIAVGDRLTLKDNQTGYTCIEAQCTLTRSLLDDNPTAVLTNFIGSFTLSGSLITGSTAAYSGSGFAYTHELSGNVFAHNTTAVAIDAGQGSVSKNLFVKNGTGFTATDASADTPLTLTRNVLLRNGDAIDVDDATGISVGANLAAFNSGWGIRVPNATDLGGNRAGHNGNSPQCVGVVCTPV